MITVAVRNVDRVRSRQLGQPLVQIHVVEQPPPRGKGGTHEPGVGENGFCAARDFDASVGDEFDREFAGFEGGLGEDGVCRSCRSRCSTCG